MPEDRHAGLEALLAELSRSVGGYPRGEGLTAVIVAAVVYAGLRVIGVDYPLVLAVLTGLGELVPVAGPILAAVPAVAVALLDSPAQAGLVLGFYVLVQQLESNVLLPHIMQRQAHVPPPLALFALFAGGTVGGVLGAIVAVPLAGALLVLVERVGAPAVRRWTGAAGRGSEDPTAGPD